MINKDIVKKRIEDPDKFISYAEFSYMLIMWYDFYYLNKNYWVILEVWWSDEWDWILSWIELTQKKLWKEVYWVTNKLILDSNGRKFWKSEWNAIWLDKEKTSPYAMYQYFINTLDEDLERYFKLFTFLSNNDIYSIVIEHNKEPELRKWQKVLWYKIIELIHWEDYAKSSQKISELLFWLWDKIDILKELTDSEINIFFSELWWFKYEKENLFELAVKSWLSKSNSEVRNAISSGAIYINEKKISSFDYDFSDDFINWKLLLIRKWKKNFRLILK